jgi:phage recombination protein Bet
MYMATCIDQIEDFIGQYIEISGIINKISNSDKLFIELQDLNFEDQLVNIIATRGVKEDYLNLKKGDAVTFYNIEVTKNGNNQIWLIIHNRTSFDYIQQSQVETIQLPTIPETYDIQNKLTIENIRKLICPLASDVEIQLFIELCLARELNPFVGEVYLIKYSKNDPAQIVVGKDAFMIRADKQKDFEGIEAGVIVEQTNGEIERRPGSLLLEGEKLLGGYARVYRKGRRSYYDEVTYKEYEGKTKSGAVKKNWAKMPATMIRKVAVVHALREAFPSVFSGLYDKSEMGVE